MTEIKFRLLDRITVTNFVDSKAKEARIGKIKAVSGDEYYLLDDLSLYELKEVGEGYCTFKEEIPYRIYDFSNDKEMYSEYINKQLSNTLNIFKVLLYFKEGKLSTEVLNPKLMQILEKHKDLPSDLIIDLSNMLEELSRKKPKERIILDPSILEVVRYYLEMTKANKALEKVSMKEFLLKVKIEVGDRIEFPATSDLIADIDQLIELLEKEGTNNKKKNKKNEEEITVSTDGSIDSSTSPSSLSPGSSNPTNSSNSNSSSTDNSNNNNNNNIANTDSDASNNSPNSSTSTSSSSTTIDQTYHTPLPYLKTFEVYTNKPFTQNDENEIARMIMNYTQLRDRKCRIHIR